MRQVIVTIGGKEYVSGLAWNDTPEKVIAKTLRSVRGWKASTAKPHTIRCKDGHHKPAKGSVKKIGEHREGKEKHTTVWTYSATCGFCGATYQYETYPFLMSDIFGL